VKFNVKKRKVMNILKTDEGLRIVIDAKASGRAGE